MSWLLLQNSFVLSFSVGLLATCLGSAVAIFGVTLRPSGRRLLSICAGITFLLPSFMVANSWMEYFGLAGTWRSYVDFNLYSFPGAVWLLTLMFWPVGYGLALAAFARMPSELLEVDPQLRGLPLVRHVLWPLSRNQLGGAFVITFVLALNQFTIPALLQVKVYAAEVWLRFNTNFNFREAAALSWPLVAGPFLLVLFFRKRPLQLKFSNTGVSPVFRQKMPIALRLLGAALTVPLLGLSLVLPLVQLLSARGTWSEFVPAFQAGSTALATSLTFAFCSTLLCLALALAAPQRSWLSVTWVLYLVPGVLLGICLILVFNRPAFNAFYQSAGIMFLAYALRYFAPAWQTWHTALENRDRALNDLSKLHGASRWHRFRYIEFAQAKGTVAAGFCFLYTLILWDVETLILVSPAGSETISLRIFNMLHYGHTAQVNALCLWMLLGAIVPPLVWLALKKGAARFLSLAGLLLLTSCGTQTPDGSIPIKSELFSSVQVFGTRGHGVAQFNKPRSVGVDKDDNFYVVDLSGRVQKFTPEGKYLLSWQMPQTDKGKPKGMTMDGQGRLVLLEPHYCRVNYFEADGKLAAQWGESGTNRGQLMFPRAIAINSRGEVYLSEYGLVERVQRFSPLGTNLIFSWGVRGQEPGQFDRPEGLGLDLQDNLYVADSCNHRVQIFSAEGKPLAQFGKPGTGLGEFSYPYDVRVDALGYRFVCEFGNSRIQIFDSQNKPVEIIGQAGSQPAEFNNPWGMAIDSRGNLYVADAVNHRIQKFTRRSYTAPSSSTALPRGREMAVKR